MIKQKRDISSTELASLIKNLTENGKDITYSVMKEKTFSEMSNRLDLDDIVMNMHEIMLEKARSSNNDMKDTDYV